MRDFEHLYMVAKDIELHGIPGVIRPNAYEDTYVCEIRKIARRLENEYERQTTNSVSNVRSRLPRSI
jgi:hypothetical protein